MPDMCARVETRTAQKAAACEARESAIGAAVKAVNDTFAQDVASRDAKAQEVLHATTPLYHPLHHSNVSCVQRGERAFQLPVLVHSSCIIYPCCTCVEEDGSFLACGTAPGRGIKDG